MQKDIPWDCKERLEKPPDLVEGGSGVTLQPKALMRGVLVAESRCAQLLPRAPRAPAYYLLILLGRL